MAAATSSHARCDRLDLRGSSSPVVTVPELSPPITTPRDFAAMIVVAEPRTHLLDSRLMFVADFGSPTGQRHHMERESKRRPSIALE